MSLHSWYHEFDSPYLPHETFHLGDCFPYGLPPLIDRIFDRFHKWEEPMKGRYHDYGYLVMTTNYDDYTEAGNTMQVGNLLYLVRAISPLRGFFPGSDGESVVIYGSPAWKMLEEALLTFRLTTSPVCILDTTCYFEAIRLEEIAFIRDMIDKFNLQHARLAPLVYQYLVNQLGRGLSIRIQQKSLPWEMVWDAMSAVEHQIVVSAIDVTQNNLFT
jgi:hypothetical protein